MSEGVKINCRASLGKRSVSYLPQDCHPSTMSITATAGVNPVLNVWVKDEDGRVFGMIIRDEEITKLRDLLNEVYPVNYKHAE